MPDIPELLNVLNSHNDRFHRVILVGSQCHQHLLAFIKYHILNNHLGQPAPLQKHIGKFTKLGDFLLF